MRRSQELEDLVARWFAAASTGDASLVDTAVSLDPGARLIGSDPSEWLHGGEAVARFLRGEVTNAAGQAQFSPEGTEAFEEGTVGWATTRLTITLPDGGHVSPRWSAVFHREGDTWRFVQTHASIGVANADIGWIYPG
ncbi:nuclear transport factor 2 family protein [Arthrobacter cavernae]|uniref:Nuclear transport factor 2 family protein n=1 Tax=Arthrobacter cavernae TaxID=2817681 RepID=A0A939HHL9_9MICC|nr:nuclear transport factor 2 family protein [Arthrobacter cavernae]MBO1267635.1 nuclear transport factor 2 family protein [Arthrobacter cavernae]